MSLIPDTAKYDLQLQLQACQSRSRRNGKVARLPADLREQINHLLDDGVPYNQIIQSLGTAAEHLNEDNLSNWRLGGYQDYLKAQVICDRAALQTQAAADVLRQNPDTSPAMLQQACTQMALLHYFNTLLKHGKQCARDSLQKNPTKYITLINACCNTANTTLALEKRRQKLARIS